MVGMDLGSPDARLEEINDAQKTDGSFSVGKLDLNLAVSKEEGSEVYGHETGAWDDTVLVNLNQQRQHDSPLSPAGVIGEESDSFCLKSSPTGRTGFDHDEVGEKSFDHDPESLHSPLKDTLYQDEIGALSDSPSGKSSYPGESEMSRIEKRTEETHQLWESSRTVDSNYQEEEDMEKINIDPCQSYSPLHDEKLKDCSGNLSRDSPREKTESTHEEVEEGASDYHARKLLSPEKMQDNTDKTTNEDFYHSMNSPSENGKIYRLHSDLHSESPKITSKRSASSGRQMSFSPERSPYIEKFPRGKPSSPQIDRDPSYSPRSSRKRHSSSLEKFGGDGKRVPSQGNLSPSGQTFISPERQSRQDTHRRGDTSPRRNYLPPGHRRQERSMSRSPVRRRDSSFGSKRDHRDRSRSKSPYARDHYRRSPRRRYSPRRRSSPSRHYSQRRSPRRRPWSPPPNRNTGVGRPGNNLFVAGFSFVTTERDLERKFSRFGRVRDVRIVRDKRSGDSRGFGFLSLERDEDADAAIRALDQTEWNGRIVLVEKSKTPTH
ncbi:serine/arginine repetitive matrix protein 2-like [Telopea speciosissima]|uniref:serine/arginine repetitive matrix protein 2-like n=1 Tax=Telopea speciosissima TaxID=54955 RepID=UPI001CC51E12|nr:serine/arginine repetitive matrix protein 2-like [Telopea speciosissima]